MDVELRQITSETVRAPCELGVTAASTSVVPSNTAATRLYESLGFRLTGEEDDGELMMVWTCDQPEAPCSASSGLIRQRSAGGNPARVMSLPPRCELSVTEPETPAVYDHQVRSVIRA